MVNDKWLPDNFSVIREGDLTIFAKKRYKEAILNLDKNLFDISENNRDANSAFVGRGHCLATTCDDMNERIVIRRYQHGGLLGLMVRDLFWNQTRPLKELLISERALEMGLRTAEVLAVIKHNILYPFFRSDIVTKEITGAFDLIRIIKDNTSTNIRIYKKKKTIIREIAFAVRKMHNIGIYHGDIHLKNMLVKENRDGNFRVYIIDLDKSKLHRSLNIAKRMKNLYRLDRSVEKLATSFRNQPDVFKRPFPISRTDRVRFFREYMRDYSENEKDWRDLIRRGFSGYRIHKLRWYVLDKVKR